MRTQLRPFHFYVLVFVWLFAGGNLYGVFRQVNSFGADAFYNASNFTRLDEIIDRTGKIADMEPFAMVLTKNVTVFSPALYRKTDVRIVEFSTLQQPFVLGQIFQLPSFGSDIRTFYGLFALRLLCEPSKFRLKKFKVARFPVNVSHKSSMRLYYRPVRKAIRWEKFETMTMSFVYWHDVKRRTARCPCRGIDQRSEMSSGSAARIKEVDNNNWLLECFPISEFRKLAIFISKAHISALCCVKGLNGVVIKTVIYSRIDPQNYQRDYLDNESGYFKGIMAFLFAVALISVGWWHVRFNDGSVVRGLVGGLITIFGWVPLLYALSLLSRHKG